jgi:hypothetical protein
MWLQSRDVINMTVYRAKQLRFEHLNIYKESFILDRTLSNITMRSIIYIFWQSSSSSKCALSAKRSIIQRASIMNSSISNEIVINSTKDETIETANADEKTTTTTTTKDLIRKSMTKKESTRFTSSLISRSWRLWTLCFVKSYIELWTRFAFNTAYETNRRSCFTRRSRNSFLSTI